MFHQVSAGIGRRGLTTSNLLCFGLLVLATALASGCEDKSLGRTCNLSSDAGPPPSQTQGGYTWQATDCPSHICTKPAVQAGVVATDVDTAPYCTITCNSDSDCSSGETRDSTNSADKRCRTGYACAIPFDKGKLCCQKLCLCRDFFVVATGAATPAICSTDPNSCS